MHSTQNTQRYLSNKRYCDIYAHTHTQMARKKLQFRLARLDTLHRATKGLLLSMSHRHPDSHYRHCQHYHHTKPLLLSLLTTVSTSQTWPKPSPRKCSTRSSTLLVAVLIATLMPRPFPFRQYYTFCPLTVKHDGHCYRSLPLIDCSLGQ